MELAQQTNGKKQFSKQRVEKTHRQKMNENI